ncbi:hypothetical protein PybrP1_007734 [[Pythium] brassicae (nom. inval.)]|nr:hypothetical protein PybrP1_007734 [[Pythium] brassicae (nom. inval.)]
MEISGIGGYRDRDRNRDRDAIPPAASSARGVSRSAGHATLLSRPPLARSLNSAFVGGASTMDDRLVAGGQRASEPILLDFDLPTPAKRAGKATERATNSDEGAAGAAPRSRAQTTHSKRKSMPLVDMITPVARITEAQKAELRAAAEERIASMLPRCQAAWDGTHGIFEDPKLWKLHSSKPNLVVYRRRDSRSASDHPFVATGRVPGLTLEDVQYGLYAETTPDERATNAYCALGEKVLVRIDQSVPPEIVPLLPDQGDLRFVRSSFSLMYMYHYDPKANEVQVFCEGTIDRGGHTPSFLANVNLSLFGQVIVNLDNIADAKFITKHGLIFPHDTAGAGKMSIALSRKACYVCFKSFGMLRRHRHHCRMCGEFDAAENAHFPLHNQPAKKKLEDSNRHGFPVVNLFKFCKKCIFMMQAAFAGRYYSRRIEKLRQEHMEREKQKLRDQHRSALAAAHGDRTSVRLFDEADFSSSETSSSHKQSLAGSDDASFDFDALVLTDSAALRSLSESDRFSAKDWKDWYPSQLPLPPAQHRSSLTGSNNQSDGSGDAAPFGGAPLMQPIDERQRSYSIPEQFEIMERSIAEQEALLSSIQHERAKPGAAPRLPIGAVMRSMASKRRAADSDSGASSGGARRSLTHSATSP